MGIYEAFREEHCLMCGTQRCPCEDIDVHTCMEAKAEKEAMDRTAAAVESDIYLKISEEIAKWPTWKKEVYNNNFAIGIHSKKLIIGDPNMTSNLSGIGENTMEIEEVVPTNMRAMDGGTSLPYKIVDSGKFNSDNTCSTCSNREICKYTDYYPELIEKIEQIDINSNFELRVWCKWHKLNMGTRR